MHPQRRCAARGGRYQTPVATILEQEVVILVISEVVVEQILHQTAVIQLKIFDIVDIYKKTATQVMRDESACC